MASKTQVLYKAEFNPRLKSYLFWTGCIASLFTVVAFPFWLLFATYFINKYFNHLECELSTRTLRLQKGYIFHTERTIPLDKIQDLTFKEGPVLRAFGLSILKVETAGNSVQAGSSDLSLIGIVGASEFRNMVLDQRDKVTDNEGRSAVNDSTLSGKETVTDLLVEIRDSLKRIENKGDLPSSQNTAV